MSPATAAASHHKQRLHGELASAVRPRYGALQQKQAPQHVIKTTCRHTLFAGIPPSKLSTVSAKYALKGPIGAIEALVQQCKLSLCLRGCFAPTDSLCYGTAGASLSIARMGQMLHSWPLLYLNWVPPFPAGRGRDEPMALSQSPAQT